MTVWEMLTKGGWLMIPIAACSVGTVWVAVERMLAYRRIRPAGSSVVERALAALKEHRVSDAGNLLAGSDYPVALVLAVAITERSRSRDILKEMVETEGNAQMNSLEHKLGLLATIAGVAPLIGFLGTVTGMIKAFQDIEAVVGNVTAKVLAGGIWEAMVTTAFGLSVGIATTLMYNYFVSRVKDISNEIEATLGKALPILSEGAGQ